MENGYLIESKPISAEQAQMLLSILNNSAIKIEHCADVMTAILSLRRIAIGIDVATAKGEPK